ncbi:MAG TPA: hypothetical protein VKA15_06495 [Isosphaeraceae bacterium]|nr:hypothetical protein [Isosphaeraceae bacterium]
MDFIAWFGFWVAAAALGTAATALKQISSLKNEVEILKTELRRRGMMEQAKGEQTLIVPEGFHPR